MAAGTMGLPMNRSLPMQANPRAMQATSGMHPVLLPQSNPMATTSGLPLQRRIPPVTSPQMLVGEQGPELISNPMRAPLDVVNANATNTILGREMGLPLRRMQEGSLTIPDYITGPTRTSIEQQWNQTTDPVTRDSITKALYPVSTQPMPATESGITPTEPYMAPSGNATTAVTQDTPISSMNPLASQSLISSGFFPGTPPAPLTGLQQGSGYGVSPISMSGLGLSPLDEQYMQQILGLRQSAQIPNISAYDVGWNAMSPTLRQLFLSGRQSRYGIPIADQLAEIQRQQLQGYHSPVRIGY